MQRGKIAMALSGLAAFLVVMILSAGSSVYAAEPSVETPQQRFQDEMSQRSLQQEALRKRAIGQFKEMCEFIELEGTQMEKAMKLFDSRIEEMVNIFDESRKGNIDQKQAREKLTKSFAQHREKFEDLLNQEQRAKLELYEKNRSQAEKKSGRS